MPIPFSNIIRIKALHIYRRINPLRVYKEYLKDQFEYSKEGIDRYQEKKSKKFLNFIIIIIQLLEVLWKIEVLRWVKLSRFNPSGYFLTSTSEIINQSFTTKGNSQNQTFQRINRNTDNLPFKYRFSGGPVACTLEGL